MGLQFILMKAKYSDFFQPILDSVADGIFTIDKRRRITSFNRAAERITGFTRDEAIGNLCHEVFHASICQNSCALEEALKTGKERSPFANSSPITPDFGQA